MNLFIPTSFRAFFFESLLYEHITLCALSLSLGSSIHHQYYHCILLWTELEEAQEEEEEEAMAMASNSQV